MSKQNSELEGRASFRCNVQVYCAGQLQAALIVSITLNINVSKEIKVAFHDLCIVIMHSGCDKQYEEIKTIKK